jgi:hypothetical protein
MRTLLGQLAVAMSVGVVWATAPAEASAQLTCMWCQETAECSPQWPGGGPNHPDCKHHFHADTEDDCAGEDPPYNCRACGGSSECHANDKQGLCHAPCVPGLLAARSRAIDALVTKLASDNSTSDNDALGTLTDQIKRRTYVSYHEGRHAIQLRDCRRIVVAEWKLPSGVRIRLT